MNVAGKTVLVTGGASRLGAALAQRFAARGAQVLVHARTPRTGGPFPVFYADFAEPGAVEKLWSALPPVGILILNASMYEAVPLTAEDPAAIRRQFEVNFFAQIAMIRAFSRQCPGSGVAVAVLDGEIAGGGGCRTGSYGLSRRALAEAVREFACELAPDIRVAGVAPGPMLAPPGLEALHMAKTLPTIPLGRPVGIGDFLDSVEFVVGNDSLTGDILTLDGGKSL